MSKQKLINSFKTNTWLIHNLAEGVTHDDSLLRLSERLNNFNWVLGHIVQARDGVLTALSQAPFTDEATKALYTTGSQPLAAEDALPLEELLARLDESLARITAAIEQADPEALEAIYDHERQTTVADRIAGLNWHETYHAGQLEILRQAGSPKPAWP